MDSKASLLASGISPALPQQQQQNGLNKNQQTNQTIKTESSTNTKQNNTLPTTTINGQIVQPTEKIPAKSSVIKTDKPRPHVCMTCTRSFARLEHLKRHERSHTKEKPFQCPVCERCFARRDLLLRHKQKLHASFMDSTPRAARGSAKRKSVVANNKQTANMKANQNASVKIENGSSTASSSISQANSISSLNSTSANTPNTSTNTPSEQANTPVNIMMMNNSMKPSSASPTGSQLLQSPAVSTHTKNSSAESTPSNNVGGGNGFATNAGSPNSNTPLNMSLDNTLQSARISSQQFQFNNNTNNSSQSSLFQQQNIQNPFTISNIPTPQSSTSPSHSELPHNDRAFPSTSSNFPTDLMENTYGDFYGLLTADGVNNTLSPETNINTPQNQNVSYNSNPNNNNNNNNNDDMRTRRFHRSASFSAASATSYSKYKDIAIMDSNHNIPPSGPTQVGFATPQLLPATLATDDNDIPTEDFFNSSDPLFINPQLLDPTFDSNFFLSNPGSATNNNHNNQIPNRSNYDDPNLSPGHNTLLEIDNDDLSWLYPTSSNNSNNIPNNQNVSKNNVTTQQQQQQMLLNRSQQQQQQQQQQNFGTQLTRQNSHPVSFNQNDNNSQNDLFSNFTFQNNGNVQSSSTNNRIIAQMSRGSLANTTGNQSDSSPSFTPDYGTPVTNVSNNAASVIASNSSNQRMLPNGLASIAPTLFGVPPPPTSSNAFSPFNNNNNINNETRSHSYVITPRLRLHILNTLSTPTPFSSNQPPCLPSAPELQLYIDAYTAHFAKHLPFLHHSLEFNTDNIPLALSMAAIGALYLFERNHSASIFEISRCCVHVYLESRRERKQQEAAAAAAANGTNSDSPFPQKNADHEITPLWLVQALLLGVVYGLFNDEPLANEIAVAQANAVISLAKSAGLHLPPRNFIPTPDPNNSTVEDRWQYFIMVQERIRTMHVVHAISCLLATGYNVTTTLRNSDIRCGSPCDENLWTAHSAHQWWMVLQQKEYDGSVANAVEGPDFLDCLSRLLNGNTLVGEIPQFTLLTLIYAIHFDIHERRLEYDNLMKQRINNPSTATRSPQSVSPFGPDDSFASDQKNDETMGEVGSIGSDRSDTIVGGGTSPASMTNPIVRERQWLDRERRRVEAILRAWETTWSLSPQAALIPKTSDGSLMSDSIPMSSLAHVRLYLDLRKIKECFWKRDFAGMGRELDLLQTPVLYEVTTGGGRKQFDALLEATSYAADTISLWEKHSARWTLQATALETFIHNIMSLFDCGLILSEFFHRLEKRDSSSWQEEEHVLVNRLRKIFYRVFDVLSSRQDAGDVLHNQQERTGSASGSSPVTNGNNSAGPGNNNNNNNNNNGNGNNNNSLNNNTNNEYLMMMMMMMANNSNNIPFNADFFSNSNSSNNHNNNLLMMMMMQQQKIPMSIVALTAVSRILSTIYIWPFALVMAQALKARIMQIRSEMSFDEKNNNNNNNGTSIPGSNAPNSRSSNGNINNNNTNNSKNATNRTGSDSNLNSNNANQMMMMMMMNEMNNSMGGNNNGNIMNAINLMNAMNNGNNSNNNNTNNNSGGSNVSLNGFNFNLPSNNNNNNFMDTLNNQNVNHNNNNNNGNNNGTTPGTNNNNTMMGGMVGNF